MIPDPELPEDPIDPEVPEEENPPKLPDTPPPATPQGGGVGVPPRPPGN